MKSVRNKQEKIPYLIHSPGSLTWSGSSLLYSQVGGIGKGNRNPIFNRCARPEYDRQCEHVGDDVWISASSNTIRHS